MSPFLQRGAYEVEQCIVERSSNNQKCPNGEFFLMKRLIYPDNQGVKGCLIGMLEEVQ